jgi:maleylacetoacetate isomerase
LRSSARGSFLASEQELRFIICTPCVAAPVSFSHFRCHAGATLPTAGIDPKPRARVILYSFFRSSAAYRVRIALNLKGLAHDTVGIHLSRDGGRHHGADYRAINPQMRVPALRLDGGEVLTQSLAIIDYLDETCPDPPLLPRDPVARAKIRAVALTIACDIHPLNNTAPLNYLKATLGAGQAEVDAWYTHWITLGFEAIEALIRPGPYAFGSGVTLADVCLVPQVYNARRFNVPLDRFPQICAVDAACQTLDAFVRAKPENQPDAE